MRIYLVFGVPLCILGILITGCAKGDKAVIGSQQENVMIMQGEEGRELFASCKDEKEAQDIAEKYGIELVEFSLGVATFHTDEDPLSVINRGKKNGWPVLSINGRGEIFTDNESGLKVDTNH
ncbi:MAG: hypothetical protein K6F86_10225 [Lachnospiraceae bacterium]|nr:hypothetical protein [Lachnospiraceae bacterium]